MTNEEEPDICEYVENSVEPCKNCPQCITALHMCKLLQETAKIAQEDKVLSEPDSRIVKFHTEVLQSVIELYAIPPERINKIVRESTLEGTEAKGLASAKHTHTLYKELFDSLKYIHDKYFNED